MVKDANQKGEFLKRAEIRTMQKDIIRLREEEVFTERERIAALRTEEEVRRERERREELKREELEREEAKEEAEMRKEIIRKAREEEMKRREEEERKKKEIILEERRLEREKAWQIEEEERRKLLERLRAREVPREEKRLPEKAEEVLVPRPIPKKPSLVEKILIRMFILLVIFGFFGLLFAFWYWYFKVREIPSPPPPPPPPLPVEEVIPEIKPEVIIPPSLIPVEETETLEISKTEEIPEKFSKVLTKVIKSGDFVRILIKNLPENKLISLSEFFEAFQIEAPDNFFQKLGGNYTLFIYSQATGKRFGLLAEIKEKEGFSDLLKPWESSMEKDFENLFVFLGKEKPAFSHYFRNGKYKEVDFRFQTFTLQDLGICYSLFNNYFLFTSSLESLNKTIDKLISPR